MVMINYLKNISKTLAMTLLLLLGVTSARATATFGLAQDVNIKPGNSTYLYITLDNDEPVWNFSFYVTLPEGLTLTNTNSIYPTGRLSNLGYTLLLDNMSDGRIRVSGLAPGLTGIEEGSGAILYFYVNAAADFDGDAASIVLDGAKATQPGGGSVDTGTQDQDANSVDFNTLSVTPGTITVDRDLEESEISLNLSNGSYKFWGLEGTLTLPEGMTLVDETITPTNRLASFTFSTIKLSDTQYRFMATTLANSDPNSIFITGTAGAVLTFKVKPSLNVQKGSVIKINNVKSVRKVGTQNVKATFNSVQVNVDVDTENLDVYNALMKQINAVQKQLNEATTTINTYGEDVAAAFTDEIAAIQAEIDALKAGVQEKFEAGTLTEEDTVDTDPIAAEIAELLEKAGAAAAQAADLAANKAAFDEYKAEQEAASNALAEDGDSEASQKLIADAVAAIDALTYDVTKTLDENKETVDAIVNKLKEDLAAQRAADKADADAAAQLAADKKAFEEYKAEQEDAAEAMAEDGDSQASQKLIADAVAAIDALTYDEAKTLAENKEAVDEIIDALKEDLAAQREADKENLGDADLIYDALKYQYFKLRKQFEDLVTYLDEECADVEANYADDVAEIEHLLDAANLKLESDYANGLLNNNSTLLNASKIAALIEKVKEQATAAQAAHDTTTSITAIKAKYGENVEIYTISGKKVMTDQLRKGIYIINGQKVVVK